MDHGDAELQINLYVQEGDGKLRPLRTDCELPAIPRIGETVSFGNRQRRAQVVGVEYLVPENGDILVGVILDREP